MKDLSTLIPAYLTKLFADIALPKWLIAGFIAFFEYIAPETSPNILRAVCGLVILDTMTGVARAKATGEDITSAKLGRFLTKSFTYVAALLTISLGMDALPNTQGMHAEIVTGLLAGIAITEIKSVAENLKAIRPDIWDLIAEALNKSLFKPSDKKELPK